MSRHVTGATIIAGDFNEREPITTLRGLRDALTTVAPDGDAAGEYSSFDPRSNPRAAAGGGAPKALDKVLVSHALVPRSLAVLREVRCSDHHPLLASLELADVTPPEESSVDLSPAARESHFTGLCAIVPFSHWAGLIAARSFGTKDAGDSGERWMPHVSVLRHFLPEAAMFREGASLEGVVARFLPLKVAFSEASVYNHGGEASSVVLEVDADAAAALRLLREAVLRALGLEIDDTKYHPHVTLCKCTSAADAERVARRIGSSLACSFSLTKLAMVSRASTPHMRVINTIGSHVACHASIEHVIRERTSSVRHVGSSLFANTATAPVASSDVDLEVALPSDVHVDRLVHDLETCGEVLLVKALTTPHGRLLRLHTQQHAEGAHLASCSPTYDLHLAIGGSAEATVVGETRPPSALHVLQDRVSALGIPAVAFGELLAAVKGRLRACGVYGQQLGFVPGYGVAIMVWRLLSTLRADAAWPDIVTEAPGAFVARFCDFYAPRGCDHALRVCNPGRDFPDPSARHIAIQSVLPPGDNIVRTATASSAAKLARALRARLDVHPFCESEVAAFPHATAFLVSADTLRLADAAQSWFVTGFLRLVLQLERRAGGEAAVSHADAWERVESSDYPFAHRLVLRSVTPLTARAGDIFQEMQLAFYSSFERASLDILTLPPRG